MGREIRRVQADWNHPRDERTGRYRPLHDGYKRDAEEFLSMLRDKGLQEAVEYFGGGPDQDDYMPDWPESERTHYQIYETISKGTPLSPPCATEEALARWLADNGTFAPWSERATYEQWLAVVKAGWAPSMVSIGGRTLTGVEAMSDAEVTGKKARHV